MRGHTELIALRRLQERNTGAAIQDRHTKAVARSLIRVAKRLP